MSRILFECDVTEFDSIPPGSNDENVFCINENCMIISLRDSKNDKILMQTEIEKKDAIELAKLILRKYNIT